MKFGVKASWMSQLNGIKIVRQVQMSASIFDRCGGECHAKSMLIFVSLSNPDFGGYLKGAQRRILFISWELCRCSAVQVPLFQKPS